MRKVHIVTELQKSVFLRTYLKGVFLELPTNSSIKKALKRGELTVNGNAVSSDYLVRNNDEIAFIRRIPELKNTFNLKKVYEDEFLAIINKPAGILSSGNYANTVARNLYSLLTPSNLEDELIPPLLLHRLDRDTSGLMVCAKTRSMKIQLSSYFEKRLIEKRYGAIVSGVPKENQIINIPIEGRHAMTKVNGVNQLSTQDVTSIIDISISTGRTHQIRKHLAEIGHPIVGDNIYGNGLTFGKGLFLVANMLKFEHPVTKENLSVNIDYPKKFLKYLHLKK